MLTTLGYEEMRRLHDERVKRSLKRFELMKSLGFIRRAEDEVQTPNIEDCRVIELPDRHETVHQVGA
ncbi:MAG TPA: hypothetical protein VF246_08770 [Acidimicrobiia bacterium]